MKRYWLFILVASVLSLVFAPAVSAEEAAGADEVNPEEGDSESEARRLGVLAKVGDHEVTVGDFEDRLNKQGPFRRVQFSAPEKRREFLQQMVEWELQALEADRRGLGDDSSVSEQMKRVMSSLLLRREVDDRVRPTNVTDEEMQGYYEEHRSTFHRPERVRAYHIVISDRTKAASLLDRVIRDEVDTREFRRLAREVSEDPVTKRRGGDLRYFTRRDDRAEGDPEVPEEVVSATFDLLKQRRALLSKAQKSAGGAKVPPSKAIDGFNPVYNKLVKTTQGFHIIRFMGHREAVHRGFDEVERQIRNRIWREKLQKSREGFIEGLRERHKVVVHEDNLELVKVDTSPGTGGRATPLESGLRPGKGPRPALGRRRGGPDKARRGGPNKARRGDGPGRSKRPRAPQSTDEGNE